MMQTISPHDVLSLQYIRDAQLSPDGCFVAYTASRVSEDGTECCDLWIQDVATGTRRAIAAGDIFATDPRWSPQGDDLAYGLMGADGARLHIYSIRTGTVRAISPPGTVISGAATWAPSGDRIAACVTVRKLGKGLQRIASRVFPSHHLQRQGNDAFTESIEACLHIYDIAGGETRVVDTGRDVCATPKWSPAGDEVLVLAMADGGAGLSLAPRLCTVNVETGKKREILGGAWSIHAAEWCPDAQRIVLIGAYAGEVAVPATALWIIRRDGTCAERRTNADVPNAGLRIHHQLPIWNLTSGRGLSVPTNDYAYLTVQTGGRAGIWRIALTGDIECKQRIAGDRSCLLLDANFAGKRLLYLVTNLFEPSQLEVAGWEEEGAVSQITDVNRGAKDKWPAMRVEHLRYCSADGVPLESWFVSRKDVVGPQPTVLFVHGGPYLATGFAFRFDTLLLVANGYAVIFANFRGSIGYGDEFAYAIAGDWGSRGFPDHMATVDYAIGLGLVDPARLGVWGASHGGFATCWIVGHTQRFRAAVAQAAVTNFSTTYYLGDAPDIWIRELGGRPDEIPDVYRSRSPITYAHRCKTPTLMIHGEADTRCPLSEAQQFYRALLDNGCITELVLLCGGHLCDSDGIPSTRVAHHGALLDWFQRHL